MSIFRVHSTVREPETPRELPDFHQALEFRGVGFSYGDGPVLENISIAIPHGTRLGLAGESGSGKSSLLNLLFRFYDPTAGEITFDGISIDAFRLADLRSRMALVSQDVLLFNTTVAENIGYGKRGATREEIIAAAKEAYAHDFISALPAGYDTPLGERGLRLSGGQRQRIAIARAFIRNAPILVLDEATASLDSQAEAEVQRGDRSPGREPHRHLRRAPALHPARDGPGRRPAAGPHGGERLFRGTSRPPGHLHRHGRAAEHLPAGSGGFLGERAMAGALTPPPGLAREGRVVYIIAHEH